LGIEVLGEPSEVAEPDLEWLSGRRWCSYDLYAMGGAEVAMDALDWVRERLIDEVNEGSLD
jgi:hypothetical protein